MKIYIGERSCRAFQSSPLRKSEFQSTYLILTQRSLSVVTGFRIQGTGTLLRSLWDSSEFQANYLPQSTST